MGIETTGEFASQFLKAWEESGKPPVEKIVYPGRGNPRSTIIFGHTDVEAWANTTDATFSDDGRFVTLEWDFKSGAFDLPSGTTKLVFDREQPIRSGRYPKTD